MAKPNISKRIHDRRDNAGKRGREFAANLREAETKEERRGVVLQFAHSLMPKKAAAALVKKEKARAERIDAEEAERELTLDAAANVEAEVSERIADANHAAEEAEEAARVRIEAAAKLVEESEAAAAAAKK